MAKTKTEQMSKMDAVRAAIRDGVVMPKEGSEHIKSRYGLDVAPNLFSAHKTKVMQEQGGGEKPAEPEPVKQGEAVQADAPKPAAPKAPKPVAPKPEAKAQPAPEPVPQAPTGSPADLARQVKQLVEKYGAGAVREMTGVFEG